MIAEPFAARRALDAQRFEPAHAAFVARATRLDAATDPDFFLRPELVELAIGDVFGRELLALARFVGGEVAGKAAQQAAIELDDARDDAIEERAVVRDHDRGRALEQQLFQRRDAVDVQVIGRLVEQQQVGLQRQCERERGALALAAGRCLRSALAHRCRGDAGIP